MLKNILTGGIGLFLSLCLNAQLGVTNDDAKENEASEDAKIFETFSLPENGNIAGTRHRGIRFHGLVKNKRLHGAWKSWFPNNIQHEEGNLKNGLPNGEWRVWFPNGQLRYVRTYSSDKYQRIRQEFHRPHPKLPNYSLTSLYLRDRKKALQFTRSSYSFKENDSQDIHVPVFNNCLHHGVFINYFEDGSIRDSGTYKHGLREGVWIESNGLNNGFNSGLYKNGLKTGTWKQFDQRKNLLKIIQYSKGRKGWEKTY